MFRPRPAMPGDGETEETKPRSATNDSGVVVVFDGPSSSKSEFEPDLDLGNETKPHEDLTAATHTFLEYGGHSYASVAPIRLKMLGKQSNPSEAGTAERSSGTSAPSMQPRIRAHSRSNAPIIVHSNPIKTTVGFAASSSQTPAAEIKAEQQTKDPLAKLQLRDYAKHMLFTSTQDNTATPTTAPSVATLKPTTTKPLHTPQDKPTNPDSTLDGEDLFGNLFSMLIS